MVLHSSVRRFFQTFLINPLCAHDAYICTKTKISDCTLELFFSEKFKKTAEQISKSQLLIFGISKELLVDAALSVRPSLFQGPLGLRGVSGPEGGPVCYIPADTRRSSIVGSMLVQRRRRWTNIEPTMAQCLVILTNTTRSINVVLMWVQRRRWWADLKTTPVQRRVFVRIAKCRYFNAAHV